MKKKKRLARNIFWTVMSLGVTTLIVIAIAYFYLLIQLPDVSTLNNAKLQVPLKVFTHDGQLIAEFGEIRRSPITLNQVPKQLIEAVLATEDQRYYEHPGVDVFGLIRAARALIITGKPTQGASTITMQVARNFFLTRKKTFSRKLNEILLALKIDHDLSKEKILELYLNVIYLGQRSYGVAAAAQVYYGKTLNQLTLPEMAMIAGLPQAPSRDNPITNPRGAIDRRNHVLQRMFEQGYISKSVYEKAIATPDDASYHGQRISVEAPYVAEMVRAAMYAQYGEKIYTDGFKVYTTIDSHLQNYANQSLRDGLIAYDHRHGYHGPSINLSHENSQDWLSYIQAIPTINHLKPAVVIRVADNSATALLANGNQIEIPWSGLSWARRYINNQYVGPAPQQANDVVKVGDVIRVQPSADGQWKLEEVPRVEGALVVINPNTGAVVALNGGFSFQQSHYNRVIQANRQPGSNFKPFIYAAALDKGYTLASIINDAPIVQQDSTGIWRPVNAQMKFFGPTRLRIGLIESRNLVSIRLLQRIGISYALNYISRFGFDPERLPHTLSLALGSGDVTPLQIVNGYAVFANGGFRVTPYIIDHVADGENKIIYQARLPIVCTENCVANIPLAPRVISPQTDFLITSALQDVIRKGTGEGALVVHRNDVAGKTGTTNDKNDAWFSGFNNDLVATVWVGFDEPESLYEFGAQAAIPIWVAFMEQALQGKPEQSFMQPPDIVSVRIDPYSGLLANPGQQNAIFEYFTQNTAPTAQAHENSNNENFEAGNNAEQQLF
jgi:penicillin-binding protein 1A